MRWGLLVASVLLVMSGCGSAVLGRWSGDLSVVGSCSDGSGSNYVDHATWLIESIGAGKLKASTAGQCDSIIMTDYGDYASIDPQLCQVVLINGTAVSPHITAGDVQVVDGSPKFLSVAVQMRIDMPPTTSCLTQSIGDLVAR